MQQKQSGSRLGVFLLALVVLVVAGLGVLMSKDVPAPQHAIEKPLDAQAFLEQKQ